MKRAMSYKGRAIVGVTFLMVLIALIFVFKSNLPQVVKGGKDVIATNQIREKVRFANANSFLTSLVNIAQEKKFFEEENLDIEITLHDVGKLAMDNMFENKSDFSIAAQTPITVASFDRKDFKIVATVSSSGNLSKILARKDKGIQKAADLKGKKVNATKGTALEHFLTIYLNENAIEKNDISISYLDLKQAIPLLLSGELDAIVAQEPFVMDTMAKMNNKGIILQSPGLYSTYGVLVVREEYLNQNPLAAEKVLRALSKASDYYYKNTMECKNFLINYHKLDFYHIDKLMDECDFRLSLNQAFLLSIENEARSVKSDGLTSKKEGPNYLEFIREEPLKKLLPKNVNIIR